MDNLTIARRLREYANYLESQEMNVYRVRAYRRAAETVLGLDRPLVEVVETEGRAGLEALPGIGPHLSFTLEGLVRTGEFRTLGSDGGRVDPERLLLSIPGVGPRLARQFHDELGVSTLEGLEMAAHDGRLARLGVGPKRLQGHHRLAGGTPRRLAPAGAGRARSRVSPTCWRSMPSTAGGRKSGLLPTLAPRRFNPDNRPWLPVYQTDRGDWFYRALFSNTAPGALAEHDARLGRGVFRRRHRVGAADGGDRDARRPAGAARGARPGARVPRTLRSRGRAVARQSAVRFLCLAAGGDLGACEPPLTPY